MKRYIKIANVGEIEPNAFKLIGASSKRNDQTKIGFFGSGLKYAMAFLLREEIEFKIYSGKTEVTVTTRAVKHRDQEFQVIQVDGEDTSMTTEMGPKWKHWGAVREVYCNAVDEGNDSIIIVDDVEVKAEPGNTIFYIELTSELTQIVDNWDPYFSKDRKDIVHESTFGSGACKIFWAKDDDFVVYRKGIQCHMAPGTVSCFHYDFPWISINESREIESMYNFRSRMIKFFAKEIDTNALTILLGKMDKGLAKFEFALDWGQLYDVIPKLWIDAVGTKTLVAAEIAGWYGDQVQRDRDSFLLLPSSMVGMIQKQVPEIKVLGGNINGFAFCEMDPSEKQTFLLTEVDKFFEESGYSIDYPIQVVKFEDGYLTGYAKDETLYVAETVFDQGRRKLAKVIYQQNEHAKTKFGSQSVAFEGHLISQVLARMEEKNAFFL